MIQQEGGRHPSEAVQVTEALNQRLRDLEITDADTRVNQNIVFIPALSVPQAVALLVALGGYPPLTLVEDNESACPSLKPPA